MIQRSGDWWMESRPMEESGQDFDTSFWQAQSPSAIFRAAWDMVVLAAQVKGQDPNELRLQRSVGVVKPIRG
jgi:hypothetical protein